VDWYHNRSARQQVFRLFGYAGSGKTTTTRSAIDSLGLEEQPSQGLCSAVLYAAFTGKAALVMTRKGTPASTIRSLIYRVSDATPEEIARIEKELFDLQRSLGRMGYAERAFAEIQMRRLELRLADIHRPTFLLNEQSRLRDASLLVLDEVSRDHRDPWRFIDLAHAKHSAKRPSREGHAAPLDGERPCSKQKPQNSRASPSTPGSANIACIAREQRRHGFFRERESIRVVLITGLAGGNQQHLIRLQSGAQPGLGCGAGMMGHAPFFTVHFEGTSEEEMRQEDRRNHDARTLICGVASALDVWLASNERSIAVRFRRIERPIRKARRSQKAIPKANNAKTAKVSAWPITGETAS